MPRPIDADALVKTFENMGLGENGLIERIFADGVFAVIENAPTIGLEPEPMEWLSPAKPGAEAWRECSACGAEVQGIAFPFCPYCGRKARNGVKEND